MKWQDEDKKVYILKAVNNKFLYYFEQNFFCHCFIYLYTEIIVIYNIYGIASIP